MNNNQKNNSNANPNVNGSWFTVESMQKSIPNFLKNRKFFRAIVRFS